MAPRIRLSHLCIYDLPVHVARSRWALYAPRHGTLYRKGQCLKCEIKGVNENEGDASDGLPLSIAGLRPASPNRAESLHTSPVRGPDTGKMSDRA